MKNSIKSNWLASFALLVSVSLVGTAIAPRPAHAILGVASGNVALAVLGGGMIAGTGILAVIEDHTNSDSSGIAELFVLIGGVVALDAKGQATPAYQAVTPEQGAALGMTESEQEAYNAPATLDQINTISQSILAQSVALPNASDSETTGFIQTSWKADASVLSPDAYSGLIKVQQGIASALQAKK